MISTIRTDSKHKDFIALVKYLDDYLAEKDGDEHSFYNQFNKIDNLNHVVVAYENDRPIGCGAIKEFDGDRMEVKRMYTNPLLRGKGVAARILAELETWAKEMEYKKCILETGKKQIEACGFYHKMNYEIIPNYAQYIGIENSLCFEKEL